MDLLAVHDRISDKRVTQGGVRKYAFIKPGERTRGTDDLSKRMLSDTYMSNVASRMLMGAKPDAPTKPTNHQVTGSSGDQNTFFIVGSQHNAGIETSRKPKMMKDTPPPQSCRTRYNARVLKEMESIAGRAEAEHIGMGGNVLIESTPRNHLSARIRDGQKADWQISARLSSRGIPETETMENELETIRSGRVAGLSTSRSIQTSSREVKLEHDNLKKELERLEGKLARVEDALETKSNRSRLSSSRRSEDQRATAR